MDWRYRKYYVVSFSPEAYQMRINIMKKIGSKLTPCKYVSKQPDEIEERGLYQFMISVSYDNAGLVEYELHKSERNDIFCYWKELHQDLSKKYFDIYGNVMPYRKCEMNPNKRCNNCMDC